MYPANNRGGISVTFLKYLYFMKNNDHFLKNNDFQDYFRNMFTSIYMGSC